MVALRGGPRGDEDRVVGCVAVKLLLGRRLSRCKVKDGGQLQVARLLHT